VVFGSPVRFSNEDAEASLFRFEADLGGGSSTKTVGFLIINIRDKTRHEHEHTRWLRTQKRCKDKVHTSGGQETPHLGSLVFILH